MKTRTSRWGVIAIAIFLAPCVLCGVGIGLNYYWRMQSYRNDVAALRTIAEQLGYTLNQHHRIYRSYSVMSSDVLTLVFWTDLSLDEFSSKVDALGFQQESYFGDDPGRGIRFLMEVNRGARGRKMTINGYETVDGSGLRHPSIKVTQWDLTAPDRRGLEIRFGRSVYSEEQFMIDGKAMPGNVVIVAYWRHGDWTDVYFRYPDPEEVLQQLNTQP